MTKLEQLIDELCPDGVEYKALSELGKFYGGLTGKSKEDFTDGNAAFITYKNVYSNPALDINPNDTVKIAKDEKQRTLEYGDVVFTGSSETPNECGFSAVVTRKPEKALYLNSFCFFFRFDEISIVDPDFVKHLFRAYSLRCQIGKTASGVTRFNVSKDKMAKISIPLPPLPVQREIVRILDNFTELTTELTARKKQYEYYEYGLLKFQEKIQFKKIGDCCKIEKGKTPIQKVIKGEYPLVATTEERQSSSEYQFDCTAVCVPLISSRGHGVASISRIYFQEGKFALGNILCAIMPNDDSELSSKFLRYYLFAKKDVLLVPLMRGGANVALTMDSLKTVKIPVPPLHEQQRIVDILDCFDTLCNDITVGLPAEIKARKQQYEYYRDRLLTFNKKEHKDVRL